MIGRFNILKKGLLVVLACFASLFLFNCEVGLGNSVDTTPPNVTITSPEKSAIIKNTFTVKGTSTDETYIKSVSVTLTSTSDKTITYGPFNATIDKTSGTWEAIINEFNNGKFKIPDGEYGVTVTAIDSASRTSIAESVYTIDNTPPVVIIKRPGLNDTFGRTIKITGDISDSNTLKALYFTPFRKNTDGTLEQLCDTQVYPNISGVGLELIVGKYFSSPEDAGFDATLDTVYKAIYDSATAGTQDVFCVIEVEDSAKEYDPPENNLSAIGSKYNSAGNLSSGYFLYDEIYSKIYGSNGYGLSNNDLVKIMNGSYEDPQKAAEVKEILSDYKLDSTEPSADKVSKFALNPENSPTYSVSGYEVTDNLYSSIFNEAKITVAVSPGRDQISVDADTIRLYLVNADNPSDVRVLYETLENIEKEADPTLKAQLKAQRNAAITEKSDSFRITTSIGKLSIGKKYNIIIEGQDLEGNLVESENGSYFGFAIQSNNKPPVITILDGSTEDLSVKNAINFHYNGTAETQAESIKLEYLVSAKNEKTGISLGSTTAEKLTATKIDETSYSWSFDLDKDKIADIVNEEIGLYTYTVTIRAINGDDGQITEISRRVYLDTEKPAPRISSIVPQITANSKENNVNGIITVAGNITDNYTLKNTVYNLYIDGQAVATDKGRFGESTTFSFPINTTEYPDKKELVIEVVTTDAAGNISEPATETVYIDQSTDKPVITLSNANEDVDSKDNVNVDTNLFDQTGNNKLLGNITDDDALKSITAEYSSDDGATWTKFYENTNLGKTTASVNIPLQKSTTDKSALAEALYKIRITAYDTKENSTSDNTPAVSTSTEFYIGIDANAPKIAINTQKDAFQSETVTVTGSVTDGNGVKSFVRDGTAITVNENGEWTDTFAAGDTGKTVTYTATDVYGRTALETFSYKVDKEKPEMEITSVDTTKDVFIGTTLSTLKSFAGTATDGTSTNASGVAKVQYSIDGTTWTDAIGTTQWNANIDFAKVETNNATVKFKALDNASNESETKSVNIILDKAVPVLDNLAIQGVTAEEGTFYVKSSVIKVTGKVTEANLESITVDGIAVNPDSNGIFTTADKTVSEGSTTCRIVATDKAGQITEKTISVYYDKTAPNAEITSVSPKVIANGKDNNVNGTITLQGTARDDDKVASTVITIATSDAENGTYTDQTSVEGALTQVTNDGMRYNYTIDTTKLTDKNFLKITVTTTDRSGNIGTDTETVYIDQSTDLPTLTFSNVNMTGEAKDNLFGMGSWTIYGTASDDDGLTSIAYKLDNAADYVSMDAENSTSKSFNYAIAQNLTGNHTLSYILTDKNGKTTEQVINFAVDNDSPVIKITEPTSEFVSASTTIIGTASDSNEIKAVEFVSLKKDGVEITPNTTPTVTLEDNTWNCTVEVKVDDISDSANYVYTFEATDKYGRTAKTSSSYKIDKTPPTLENIEISDGKKPVSSTESSEKWFNQSALTLSGKITEKNLDSITMTYNNKTVIVTPVNNFSITESFDFEGKGVINFVIKDKAGNQIQQQISLNIDTTAPTIDSNNISFNIAGKTYKEDSTKLQDLKKAVTDTGSGIAAYYVGTTSGFKVENNILKKDKEEDNEEGTEEDIKTIDLSNLLDGKNYLYLRVVDNAGNSTEVLLGEFIRDTKPPAVAYSSPSANATVNKTITLTGSVSDANSMEGKTPSLYIKDGEWKTIGKEGTVIVISGINFVAVNGGEWEISGIDTTVFNSAVDAKQVELQVRFSDAAGNAISETGTSIKLTVDQNADRPVIKLNNINTDENNPTTLRSPELNGSITDDDGEVDQLYIQLVKDAATITDDNWKEVTVNSGNWTYNVPGEGSYDAYFKVIDKEGTEFETNATTLNKPYLQYQSNDKVDGSVKFSLDTNPPAITNMQISYDGGATYEEVNNNAIFGGAKGNLKFKVIAEDTISKNLKVTMNFNGEKAMSQIASTNEYTLDVDATQIPSDSYTITVTAKDDAGQPGQYTRLVIVDNNAPDSNCIKLNFDTSTELTDKFKVTGTVEDIDQGKSGIATMQFALPPYQITSYNDSKLEWQDVTSLTLGSTWEINFNDSSNSSESETKVDYTNLRNFKSLNDYYSNKFTNIIGFDGYSTYGDGSGVYLLPIWLKVTDNAGNIGYITDKVVIRYNPDANKPRTTITYPVADTTDIQNGFEYVTTGGTIRITGSAEDNVSVSSVWLQFDMDGNGNFDYLNKTTSSDILALPDTSNSIEVIPGTEEYGIKANGTFSWNHSIVVSGISGLNYVENNKTLGIRVRAIDNNGELGAWSNVLHVSVNNQVPKFDSFKLKRFDDGENTIAEMDYTPDMYIKGSGWVLTGATSDSDDFKEISVTGSVNGNLSTPGWFTKSNKEETTEYEIKIPITSVDSKYEITITSTDAGENELSSSQKISINIDNDAPTFNGANNDDLVLYKDGYGSNGTILSPSNSIVNSNRYFTVAGSVTEEGSGFERVVFYFQRNGTDGKRVYNPMKPHTKDDTEEDKVRTENRTDITDSKTEGSVYINDENLPVLRGEVTRPNDESNASTDNLTYTGIANNDNIRVGGLVKLGGVYRKILTKENDTITFTPGCSVEFIDAEFVYGMVVDHSGESLSLGQDKEQDVIKNDDSDGMPESLSKATSTYTWDASIDSNNIPDGPIELHCVVFDVAGNSRHGYVESTVSNNAPRITYVRLGTNLNGSTDDSYKDTYEESEYNTFYANLDTTGNGNTEYGVEVWNLDTATYKDINVATPKAWTAKKGLSVIPEFVGGTGDIYYIYSKSTGETQINLTEPDKDINLIDKEDAKVGNAINLNNTTLTNSGENQINTYRFSFWDSTEETIPGYTSQWTILNVKLKQDLVDDIAPTVKINPLYWDSKDHNSLYENSTANGHIELSSDLDPENFVGSTFTESSGVMDSDDKVSGKITFTGTAYDDVRLSSITFTFGKDDSIEFSGTATFENDNWGEKIGTIAAGDEDEYEYGYEFSIDSNSLDQNGHLVEWTLSIDTSKINGVAAANVNLTVTASDHTNNVLNKASANKQVDVVPYITEVQTWLSRELKTSIRDAYSRTASGRYPVYDGEEVTLFGFNLTQNTITVTTTGALNYTGAGTLLNNINNNDARGSYSTDITEESSYEIKNNYAYNRLANGRTNNLLTDDIYFDVWEFDSDAALPVSGHLSEPVMKINPVTGKVGFAFVSGPADFSMGNGTGDSYTTYQHNYATFSNISFAYDDKGRSYGTTTGLDTYPDGETNTLAGRFTFMTSRWGTGDLDSMNDNYENTNKIRFDAIGLPGSNRCYVKGTYPSSYTMTEKRFASPSMAVTTHGTNNDATVYLAYYDDVQDQIRFRYGTVPGNRKSFNNFVDNKGLGGDGTYDYEDRNDWNFKHVFESNTDNFSLIAGADWQKIKTAKDAANGYTKEVGDNYFYDTGYDADAHVAIDVVKGSSAANDIVVAVWFDGKDCYYAYNTTPQSGKDNGVEGGWVTTKIFSGGGEYCTIKVDSSKDPSNGIHIAANVDGALKYAYLSSYDASYSESTQAITIDSCAITGEQINIDVGKKTINGTPREIPHISYYMSASKKPCIAYITEKAFASTNPYQAAGTDSNDCFTGNWEVSVIPTQTQLSGGHSDKINVGLWKNNGSIVNSYLKNANGQTQNVPAAGNTSTTSSGNVYGNGTANPIFGYAVKSTSGTCVETAQMK